MKLHSSTRSRRAPPAASNRTNDIDPEDFYSLLEVSPGAAVADQQLKDNYRRLQKRYHPDVYGDGGKKSQELNAAYDTLSQPERRAEYDRGLRATGGGGKRAPWLSKEGVVGPLQAGTLVASEQLQCAPDTRADSLCELALTDREEIVTFVRQWAQTLSYGAEMPLPMPLQTDAVEGGVRVAVIGTASDNTLQSRGELFFTVAEEAEGAETKSVTVEVRRRLPAGATTLPGEARILKAFRNAMNKLSGGGGGGGFQLSGLFAGLAQGVLGLIPFGTDDTTAYDAYYLRPACKQGGAGDYMLRERWGVAKSTASQSMRWGGDHARLRRIVSDAELNAFEVKAAAAMAAGDLQSGEALAATCDELEALVEELSASTRGV